MSQHFCHQAGYAQNDAWLTRALDEVLQKLDPAPGKAITYRQIDVVLDDAGIEPDLATQLYERILRTLEECQVQVVEAEESDLGNDDFATASSRDIFGCSKNRQNRIVENSTYPLDDFGFR